MRNFSEKFDILESPGLAVPREVQGPIYKNLTDLAKCC